MAMEEAGVDAEVDEMSWNFHFSEALAMELAGGDVAAWHEVQPSNLDLLASSSSMTAFADET